MKTNLFIALLFSCIIAINPGCKKSDPETATNTSTDPKDLILGKWILIKDSIATYQFQFSNGTIPIPGVYYNTTGNDNYLFQNNGTVIINEGGPQLSSAYSLTSGTSLLMNGFAWGDVHIMTLNSNSFTWEKSLTSGSSGTYYRRAYFRR
jgi:hypothetical protein